MLLLLKEEEKVTEEVEEEGFILKVILSLAAITTLRTVGKRRKKGIGSADSRNLGIIWKIFWEYFLI